MSDISGSLFGDDSSLAVKPEPKKPNLPEAPEGFEWQKKERIEAPQSLKDTSSFANQMVQEAQMMPAEQGVESMVSVDKTAGATSFWIEKFMGVDNDAARLVNSVARNTDIPEDIVQSDPTYAKKVFQAMETWEKLSQKNEKGEYLYPTTVALFNDPDNTRQGLDDANSWMALENAVKKRQQEKDVWGSSVHRALTSGVLNAASMIASIPSGAAEFFDTWVSGESFFVVDDENKLRREKGLPEVTVDQYHKLPKDQRLASTPIYFSDNMDFFRGLSKSLENDARAVMPVDASQSITEQVSKGDYSGASTNIGLNITAQVPQLAVLIGSNILGLSRLALPAFFASSYDQGVQEAQGDNASFLQSQVRGLGYGTFEAGMELVTLGILDDLAKVPAQMAYKSGWEFAKDMGKMFTANTIKEGGSELGTSVGQSLTNWATGGKITTQQALDQGIMATVVGGASGTGMTAITTPSIVLSRWAAIQQEAIKKTADVEMINNSEAIMTESKVAQTNPDKAAEMHDATLANNGITTDVEIYTDELGVLFQDNAEAEKEFWKKMGIDQAVVDGAKESASPVTVSIGKLTAHYKGTPVMETLKNLMLNESQQAQEQARRILADYKAERDSIQKSEVYESIRSKMIEEGVSTRKAEAQATVFHAMLTRLGSYQGITADEYAKQNPMILKFGGVPSEVIQQYQRGQLADMAKGVDLGSVLPQLEGKQAAIEVTATDGQTRQWSGDAKQMVNRLNSHVEVLNLLKDCIG